MRREALPDYPVPGLMEMAALLARCRLLVGNDNGPRHFAIAVGTPTVGIFGRTRAVNWTPPAAPAHRALEFDPGCKAACTYPRCGLECLDGVPVAAVLEAADALLGPPGAAV
jgi:ADP-heptose:LPS heptosyltransferase